MMANSYQIQFATQLRHHLRAFRKMRGLTQAQAGALIGVSQGRIAEIEANPGLVNLDQIMQLLSILDVGIALSDISPTTNEQNTNGQNTSTQKSTHDNPMSSAMLQNSDVLNSTNEALKQMRDLGNVKKGTW